MLQSPELTSGDFTKEASRNIHCVVTVNVQGSLRSALPGWVSTRFCLWCLQYLPSVPINFLCVYGPSPASINFCEVYGSKPSYVQKTELLWKILVTACAFAMCMGGVSG